MRHVLKCLLLCVSLVGAGPVLADNCIAKFQGDWLVHMNNGPQYVGHHLPNGTVTADCFGCSAGTWTCSGNFIYKQVNGINITGSISASGNYIDEVSSVGGERLSRIGTTPAATPEDVRRNNYHQSADDFMREAKGFASECSRYSQEHAEDDFSIAAQAYERAGDAASAANARSLQNTAAQNVRRCSKGGNSGTVASSSGGSSKSCTAGYRQMLRLESRGEDVTAIREALQANHCPGM